VAIEEVNMAGWRILVAHMTLLALTAALAQATEPNVQAFINELKGQGEAKTRTPAELQAAYASAIDALLPDLGSPDVGRRGSAQGTLEAISWRASRPGAPAERAAYGAALAAKLPAAAAPDARVWLIRQLQWVGGAECIPALAAVLSDADAMVRDCARRALQAIPAPEAGAALLAALAKAPTPEWRVALLNAVGGRKDAAAAACAAPALAALAGSSPAGRVALLGVLAKTGTAKALVAARGALKDADPAVQEAALRALADWPDAAPAADLLAIAKADEKATRQVIALRGYVRLTGLATGPAAGKVAMYKEAMAAARRPDDKKMVLAAMADSPSMATLEMARSCLADASLKAEAAAALVKIAAGVGGENRDEAKAALQQVIQSADDNTRRQAQDAINVLEKNEDFIMAWQLSGPYTQADKDAAALFDIAFPPEQGDGAKAKWVPLPGTAIDPGMPGVIGLDKALGGDNRCAYLRTGVYSPKAQDVSLEVGSDDGVKIWLNGKVVHANNVNRGLAVNQDKVKAALAQGWNTVLMKITQGAAQWAASLRIRQPNGSKLDGLRLSTEPAK
jgi:hypothetical protein